MKEKDVQERPTNKELCNQFNKSNIQNSTEHTVAIVQKNNNKNSMGRSKWKKMKGISRRRWGETVMQGIRNKQIINRKQRAKDKKSLLFIIDNKRNMKSKIQQMK